MVRHAGVFLHAAFLQRGFEGALDTAGIPRLCGRGYRRPCASGRRKEPDGMAIGAPMLAQQLEGALGQGHIAVFVAFALPDVEHHPFAVNITDLQRYAFTQAQAARVNRGQAHTVVRATSAH